MTVTLPKTPSPIPKPAPPKSPSPAREPAFPPSAELGEQLLGLEKTQVEIDRKKVEELARLRELQDRD